jgi:hypothetical protein
MPEKISTSRTARAIAPEDLRPGCYVIVLHEVFEFLAPALCDSAEAWRRTAPIRVRGLPFYTTAPMKVKAVCLPHVFVRSADGDHRTLDVRELDLAEVPKSYAKEVIRSLREATRASKKSTSRRRGKK